MENPYIKQYPGLMKGKKIMYVHGFGSSARSGTVTRLREMLPEANVVAFDLPVDPHEAIALLHRKQEEEQPTSSSALRWAACMPSSFMAPTAYC